MQFETNTTRHKTRKSASTFQAPQSEARVKHVLVTNLLLFVPFGSVGFLGGRRSLPSFSVVPRGACGRHLVTNVVPRTRKNPPCNTVRRESSIPRADRTRDGNARSIAALTGLSRRCTWVLLGRYPSNLLAADELAGFVFHHHHQVRGRVAGCNETGTVTGDIAQGIRPSILHAHTRNTWSMEYLQMDSRGDKTTFTQKTTRAYGSCHARLQSIVFGTESLSGKEYS